MKANELQIDDWVKIVKGNGYTQLDASDLYNISRWGMDVEPIPLTEEILKANGFVKDSDYWMFPNGDSLCIEINDYNGEDYPFHILRLTNDEPVEFVSFRYVHELQHTLRLCGLTDLADNFKLKAIEE